MMILLRNISKKQHLLQWKQQHSCYPTNYVLNKASIKTTTTTTFRNEHFMAVIYVRSFASSSSSSSLLSKWLNASSSSSSFPTIGDNTSNNSNVQGKEQKEDEQERPVWSEEWKRLGLGAKLVTTKTNFPTKLFFVQLGFGVDQHGDRSDATKASIRAVRNAIEFNSIPGVIEHLPGGRQEMLIHVKLGIPNNNNNDNNNNNTTKVNLLEVAKVFPYGKLLPIQVTTGGLDFPTGRVVEELGDSDDIGICVCACITIGYDDDDDDDENDHHDEKKTKDESSSASSSYKTYNTKDGY